MLEGIDDIAIAVESLEESIPFYRDSLGLELVGREEVSDQKVRVAFFKVGNTKIELLEPTTEDSPISSFLRKRGPGIHHLALASKDVSESLKGLSDQGVRLIDEIPRKGAEGKDIAFIHPKSTGGVLLELCSEGGAHES